jgi:hypothetical protein
MLLFLLIVGVLFSVMTLFIGTELLIVAHYIHRVKLEKKYFWHEVCTTVDDNALQAVAFYNWYCWETGDKDWLLAMEVLEEMRNEDLLN